MHVDGWSGVKDLSAGARSGIGGERRGEESARFGRGR